MSKHYELNDLRSEGIHFENKYKLMILKITIMPQIKEAFVGSEHKHKIYITISIRFLFWRLVYKHNNFLFVLTLLISILTFVFLLLSLFASALPDIRMIFFSFHEWKQNNCATKYQTYFGKQLNNFWTWSHRMLMKYQTGDSAERIRIIQHSSGSKCLLLALQFVPEKVFSSDHNSNLKWTILWT
jgi:hypothetical protein